jgi:hypothetical protein
MDDEKTQFLHTLLLRLAEAHEEGKGRAVLLEHETQAKREVVTQLKAEGSITEFMKGVRFTNAGYSKHLPKIKALRAFGKSN